MAFTGLPASGEDLVKAGTYIPNTAFIPNLRLASVFAFQAVTSNFPVDRTHHIFTLKLAQTSFFHKGKTKQNKKLPNQACIKNLLIPWH